MSLLASVLTPPAAALACLAAAGASEPGACTVRTGDGVVLVTGDGAANVVRIVAAGRVVRVACDGAEETLGSVEDVVVEAGDGEDKLAIVGTEVSERFDVEAGSGPGAARVEVAGLTIAASTIELLAVEGGAGDDVFETVGLPAVALVLRGGPGDDEWKYVSARRFAVFVEQSLGQGLEWAVFEGGSGEDRLDLVTSSDGQLIEVLGVPDREVPDPELRVTDLEQDLLVADLFVQETERVGIETGPGEDRVEVAPEASSSVALLSVDLGNGDDVLGAAGDLAVRAQPGRGFDTARVTANLLPFVTAFERIERP